MRLSILQYYSVFKKGASLISLVLLIGLTSCKEETKAYAAPNNFSTTVTDFFSGNSNKIPEALLNSENSSLFQPDSVKAFYNNRDNNLAWSNPKFRNAFIDTLKLAEYQGLFYNDYHGRELEKMLSNLNDLNQQELIKLDYLLTDAFFKFGNHLLNGKIDPKNLPKTWDIPKNRRNQVKLLEQAVDKNNLEIALSQLRPTHPIYQKLIAASKEYQKLKNELSGFEEIEKGELIKPGMQDQRLLKIQIRLKALGYLRPIDTLSNYYSETVQEAIKQFQQENGLMVDGIIGNKSIGMLNQGFDKRAEQILVNLERWRWFPRDLGSHYILINIANFQLRVVKGNKTISTHKVIVGRESRKTPIFSDEIEFLDFNPSWFIPPTIKNKDVIPGARRNPSYLVNKNIDVYNNIGQKLNPFQIDWSGSAVRSYQYKQEPGPTNPLGEVKISFPNKYIVYLHDTSSKSLFEGNSRAHSSGCIRVENAVDLAKYLLSDQKEFTSEEIDKIIDKGTTRRIYMDQKVNVHIFYWTAWRENGKTRFTDDIYNYDEATYEALKKAF
ncbi:MAG TPA: L,D-transpeptidase family protein [Gillisia sp.]|nr:L,D-transpeptidase family protein [Gillisia sp.]